MSDDVSRQMAMDCIEDDILSAANLIKSEDRGVISDIYDIYKDFTDNRLSARSVNCALADESAGLLALNSADAGALTKRDYYLESKERMVSLTMARLRRSDIKVTESRRNEIYQDIERYIRINLEQVKELSQVRSLKQTVLNADDAAFARLMSDYVSAAEKANLPLSLEGHRPLRPPLPPFSVPGRYNTGETISFGEVYFNERGVTFNPQNIENYNLRKNELSVAQGAYNKYQSFAAQADRLMKIDDSSELAQGIADLYHQYYAAAPQDNAAALALDTAVKAAGAKCWPVRDAQNIARLDMSAYPDPAEQTQVLRKILTAGRSLQQQQLNRVLGSRKVDDYITNYRQTRQSALGSQNSAALANAMLEDNLQVIDRVADIGTTAGLVLTVAGGVVSFAVPPAAPLGLVVSKAGTGLSLGSMGARTAAGYAEALTRDNFNPAELTRRNQDFVMDIAGFAVGSAAGAAGGKFARGLVNRGTGRVAALIADKGTDYTLSLAGDLAMMGALQTQQNIGDLAENNLMGLAVSTVSGLRHGLRRGANIDSSADVLGIKRVTLENGRYQVTSTRDLEREHIVSLNHTQAQNILAAAGIDESHPAYQQYYAQTLAAVHHGRQYSADAQIVSQRITAELQKPDITPEKMQQFVRSYQNEVIESQQKNASGNTSDNRYQNSQTLRQNINQTLRSGVELRRAINPGYPEIFYNKQGVLEDVIIDLTTGGENSAIGIINRTVERYKKFNLEFDSAANKFLYKGNPVNVQNFFKSKHEQLNNFLSKVKQEPESLDLADKEIFYTIASGDYARFIELKKQRGKGGDKRNLALRNALNDEILFDRFSEEIRSQNLDRQTFIRCVENLQQDYYKKSAIIAKESERGRIISTGTDLADNEIDRIELSVRPAELAKQSTYQNWKSCMNAAGKNHRYVDDSIGQGSIVAYGFNSKNPQRKISRLLLHPYINDEGKTIYIPNDRLYGESNNAFVTAVHSFAENLNEGKAGFYKFNANRAEHADGLYPDNSLMDNNFTSIARGEVDFSKLESSDEVDAINWSKAEKIIVSDSQTNVDLRNVPLDLIKKFDMSACENTIKINSRDWEQLDKSKISPKAKIEKTFSILVENEETLDLSAVVEKSIALREKKGTMAACAVTLPDDLQNLSIMGS